nr:hypothetical protein [Cressdnaviricota sp.]
MKVKDTCKSLVVWKDELPSVNSLDKTDGNEERDKIYQLHNILYDHYTETTPYELTITFDDKKLKRIWNTDINHEDDVFSAVRCIMHEFDNNFKWFVIREWSDHGIGRLHFHGILNQIKGGQTQMAKLQNTLKRYFGRDCRIKNIYSIENYICYMLKRIYREHYYLPEEWVSSELLHTWMNIFYEEINAPKYTEQAIRTWNLLNKED